MDMDIDDLLNKYFEGETSAEEERLIRVFFAKEKVPERLVIYKPFFAYFDEEIRKIEKPYKKVSMLKIIIWGAVAASLLLAAGLWLENVGSDIKDPCLCSANYVIINGKCYTDIDKARNMALEALHEVATPVEDFFPDDDFFNNEI